MDKYDLLEAMGQIRDQYIEEASREKPGRQKRRKLSRVHSWALSAAAVLFLSILIPNVSPGASSAFQDLPLFGQYFRAVTFRVYQYQDASSDAVAQESALVTMGAGEEKMLVMDEEAFEEASEYEKTAGYAEAAGYDPTSGYEKAPVPDRDPSASAALAAADITEEIRRMAQERIAEFEKSVEEESGYHSLRFLHRTVTDTDDWYCMEILCYTSSADGFEEVVHFTIDKRTGKRVTLESLFDKNGDYIALISDTIREQMRSQMAADPEVEYWIDSGEDPEMDFQKIREDQDFYINSDGDLVICFNELEAAPMYMGCLEFVIPEEISHIHERY